MDAPNGKSLIKTKWRSKISYKGCFLHYLSDEAYYDYNRHESYEQTLFRCYQEALKQKARYFSVQKDGVCRSTNTKYLIQKVKANHLNYYESALIENPDTLRDYVPVYEIKAFHPKRLKKVAEKARYSRLNPPEQEQEEIMDDPMAAFAKYTYDEIKVGDEMDCPSVPNNFFDLSPTQLFIQKYFHENSIIKGMLSYASAGSGKTCQALNVIGNFMGKWKIFWITRKSLRDTPLKNLYRDICQIRLRELIDDPKPITLASGEILATTKTEKINFIRSDRAPAILKRYGIEIEKQRIITYDDFAGMIAGKGTDGVKLRNQQLEDSPNGDMGYKTLFVFDEAHNLVTPGLPEDERKILDSSFENVEISGKRFHSLQDIYGNLNGIKNDTISGRDLIAAMLYQSYQKSGSDSAKVLLLTATPMSTSPRELFWLLNLLLEKPQDRLSLDINDYYDSASMKLKDEAVMKFANAAHGRISYFDTTRNPTKFAKKIFYDRKDAVLHKFHQKIIDEAVQKEEKKRKSPDSTRMVALYRNLSLMAKVKGAFFDQQTIRNYEQELKRLESWNPEQETKYQTELYHQEIDKAREIFGMAPRASDISTYEKKAQQYKKWAEKNVLDPTPLSAPTNIKDILDVNGDFKPFEEWSQDSEQKSEMKIPDIPKDVQKRYKELIKRKHQYEEKLKQFAEKKLERKPRKPQINDLMNPDGTTKTETEFYQKIWEKKHITTKDKQTYERLKAEYTEYKSKLIQFEQVEKQSRMKKTDPKFPPRSATIDNVMDDYGQLMSLSEWFKTHLESKRMKKTKAKYKATEQQYLKYLIRDPASGKMRVRSLEEFIRLRSPKPTLEGEESRKGLSMLMWYKNFNGEAFKELMPYYAPKIHDCIENIIDIEKSARATHKHGFKHTVFTFSVAGKGIDSSYGARIVASAFQARADMFRVLLVYKEDEDGKFILHHNIPQESEDDDRWGVAILSSKNLPNIYFKEHGGNQTVEYNPKIIGATQAAFNDAKNRYGDRIKVLIMDGAYTEGVEAYDDNIAHFLHQGLSKSQLEQASARSVRYCRSKAIPFYKNIGGFLEMYFYGLKAPDSQEDLYDQMLKHVPFEEQLNMNMMDVFKDLSAQFSIDYWLNININEYNPVFQGEIIKYYDRWNRSYVIHKELIMTHPGKADPKQPYEFVVDPNSMITPFQIGHTVTDESGRLAEIIHIDLPTDKYLIRYIQIPPPTTSEIIETSKSKHQLRLAPGQMVEFHIPYGVDLAQKVMNIGNYNAMHPSAIVEDTIKDIEIPENAMTAIATSFRNNVNFTLLGFLSILRMIIKAGGAGTPIHFVLPAVTNINLLPTLPDFSVQWSCTQNHERLLEYHTHTMKSFLSPKDGISIMLLVLNGSLCGSAANTSHTNILLYIPAWKTVERFDPIGYSAHWYDSVALDARLYDHFQKLDPEIRFMSSAESCPLFGIQRLQIREKSKRHTMDPQSYCAAFGLFYMHMRILYAAQALKDYPKEKREIYPLHFQRGLIQAMKLQFNGKLTEYIRNYAELAVTSKDFVSTWNLYETNLPFWANTTDLIRQLSQTAAKKQPPIQDTKEPEKRKDMNIFDRLKIVAQSLF